MMKSKLSQNIRKSIFLVLLLSAVIQCKKDSKPIPPPYQPPLLSVAVDINTKYQTMDGVGASLAFYTGWFVVNSQKTEIYDQVFGGLKLSILRVMTSGNLDDIVEFAANAKRSLGHDIPILATSWAPSAACKSNNKTTGQDGTNNTLKYTIVNGVPVFDYTTFANWWVSKLTEFKNRGVYPTYISIQNEPGWNAPYESCLFAAEEITTGAEVTWRAGYGKAFLAVYNAIKDSGLPIPKFVGPEGVSMRDYDTQNLCDKMDLTKLYAIGYHTYCGDDSDTQIPWLTALNSYCIPKNNFIRWETEYSDNGDWINQAVHVHNNFTIGNASAYFYWALLWAKGTTPAGLIDMDNPWQSPTYYVNDKYYSIKHYSYFIEKGDIRIRTDVVTSTDNSIRISAFLSADKKKVRIMVINTSGSIEQKLSISVPGFESAAVNEYQSTDLLKFKTINSSKPGSISIPARSLTTLELVLP